jgi:hypothetical protein
MGGLIDEPNYLLCYAFRKKKQQKKQKQKTKKT